MEKLSMITSKTLIIFCIFFAGCKTQKKNLDSLHNFPIVEGLPCPTEVKYKNKSEQQLRYEAKKLKISFPNYLHKINSQKKQND